jgi:signal transduction histidine kinase
MGGLRSLVVDIYPPTLRSAGLPATLRDLAATAPVPVRLQLDEDAVARLTAEQQQAMFRIAQEALRNTAKHAGATAAVVRIAADGDDVVLDVGDNGRGFDPAERPSEHLGISLMTDVATDMGAQLDLRTAPGQGTMWRMRVPVT